MIKRPRRLRKNAVIRAMVSETSLKKSDLIYPLFITDGTDIKDAIETMPGIFRFSVDRLGEEIAQAEAAGVCSVLLFGIPQHKDECGSEGFAENGVVQRAIREIHAVSPDMYVITDVCMCEYTSHGHCGILSCDGVVDNDKTLEYLARIALSHAAAGADMIAPSDMMDGRVGYIRQELDKSGFEDIPIMAYSAKYASAFYGPFRCAADSAPSFGDRKGYQMDCRNSDEALREVELDIDEGADIVIVKPAMPCLDIIRRVKDNFNIPIAAYCVSGEYTMLKNAVNQGLLSEDAIMETHLAIKRAGAGMIITYFAKDLCGRLG